MDLASKYFNGVNWRYIDHSSGLEPMQSFAFDDTFAKVWAKIYQIMLCVLGFINILLFLVFMIQDCCFKDGIDYLTNEIGYNAIVRNSGGLGVVLDQGVLNISLMFKGQTETTIDEAFTVMYLLISKMFEDENVDIDTMEIEHSYCPGKFDLSIDGKNLQAYRNEELEAVLLYKFIFVLKALVQNVH